MSEDTQVDQWLSLSAAAKKLDVHPSTLRRWADNGEIAVMTTPGGHRRFALSDVEQFARARWGIRRASGIEQAWADRALTRTRQGIQAHQNDSWLAQIDDETRQQNRQMGRQLMALTLQFVSNDADEEELLVEAERLGQKYGRYCQKMAMPLKDALQASIFFRDMMVETALQLPESVRIKPEANLRLMRRINTLLNAVHLAIAEVYDAS